MSDALFIKGKIAIKCPCGSEEHGITVDNY